MALSYMQEQQFAAAGYLASQGHAMTKDVVEKQHHHSNRHHQQQNSQQHSLNVHQPTPSPPLINNNMNINNNNNNINNVSATNNPTNASSVFVNMALMNPTLAAFAVMQQHLHQNSMTAASFVPSLYNPHFLPAWPQSASSPPSTLTNVSPITPALSTSNKSSSSLNNKHHNNNDNNNSTTNNNNNTSSHNNNNVTSSTNNNNNNNYNNNNNNNSIDWLVDRKSKSLSISSKKRPVPTPRLKNVDGSNRGIGSSSISNSSINRQARNIVEDKASQQASSPTSSNSPETVGRDKVFTCGICNRSFGYKHVLQNHERTHTGEKPFECKECHKKFTRDHHLKTHMRLHTGEKPYHCSHCDRQFVQVANLRRHLRVHTGERPYVCDICHNKFSDSNQLKAHQLIHKDEKPFDCKQCQQRFRRKHHFVQHKCVGTIGGSTVSAVNISTITNTAALIGSTSKNLRPIAVRVGKKKSLNPKFNSTNLIVKSERIDEDEEESNSLMEEEEDDEEEEVMDEEEDDDKNNISTMNVDNVVEENYNDVDENMDVEMYKAARQQPLNLSYAVDLPVQTEPEDLSMGSSRSRFDESFGNIINHSNNSNSYNKSVSRIGFVNGSSSPISGLGSEVDDEDSCNASYQISIPSPMSAR